jgi:hypothetical protein
VLQVCHSMRHVVVRGRLLTVQLSPQFISLLDLAPAMRARNRTLCRLYVLAGDWSMRWLVIQACSVLSCLCSGRTLHYSYAGPTTCCMKL